MAESTSSKSVGTERKSIVAPVRRVHPKFVGWLRKRWLCLTVLQTLSIVFRMIDIVVKIAQLFDREAR